MNSRGRDGWQPLEGLRIIELATYVAGPSGAMALAQLGAEVIRVDPIGGATDTKRLPLAPDGRSLYWAGLDDKSKRSIEIDTGSVEGRQLVIDLLGTAGSGGGILLTNAVGQPWLEYESLRAHRADLIHVHIRGHSEGAAAVDYTINSEVGLPLITGPEESSRPVNHVLPAWDLLTGLHAGLAILAAERERASTGAGQAITISLADVALATMAHLGFIADVAVNGHARLREGNYLYGSFGCDFETADGHRVMVVALTPRHWKHLVDVTGLGAVINALEQALDVDLGREEERYRHREVLTGLLRPWFASHTADEVEKELDARGVLQGRYRTVDELVRSPDSLLARSPIFEELHHEGIGIYPVPGSVLRSATGSLPPRTAPTLGTNTDEVLHEILGLDNEMVGSLRDAGVIGG